VDSEPSACRNLVAKTFGKHLTQSRRRREDNIKMDLRVGGCEDVKWLELAQDRVE
jgi:hypothetical protein